MAQEHLDMGIAQQACPAVDCFRRLDALRSTGQYIGDLRNRCRILNTDRRATPSDGRLNFYIWSEQNCHGKESCACKGSMQNTSRYFTEVNGTKGWSTSTKGWFTTVTKGWFTFNQVTVSMIRC